ncbi:hypothetical protein ABWJ92_29175 [Streptomyces sp. NPDC000609]|uniref:hypothetical protein n=1 Tax=Streptomyces sp. NPDC000609 TaxID=3160957 RepID=UPI00339668F3
MGVVTHPGYLSIGLDGSPADSFHPAPFRWCCANHVRHGPEDRGPAYALRAKGEMTAQSATAEPYELP